MHSRAPIAILGINYPPEPTGIAPYTGGLATGLASRGYGVTVHTAHPHYPWWTVKDGYGQWSRLDLVDDVDVHRRLHYVPRAPRGFKRLISELSFGVRLLFGRLPHSRLVVTVSPSLFATALAIIRFRLAPRPPLLVVWVQDIYTLGLSETGEAGGFATRIMKWIEATTLQAADHVVVIHNRFAEYVCESLGVPPDKVVVVRNWSHLPTLKKLSPEQAKHALGWPTNLITAVHTGNMGAKQGLENIVEAARIADKNAVPVHFVLIGDGSERTKLTTLAQNVARISILDPLSEDEYNCALAAADVLLVNEKPGVASMAVPSKLTSYFHAGRPVIAATDPGGITASEIITADAGIVVPADRPDELLQAIQELANDPSQMERFGRNGQRFREDNLSEESAIDRWSQLISGALTTKDTDGSNKLA